ncbi:hypothetical protein [Nocardia sp. NBC_01327]|uniref:hypothetical protein n=1 Tax=Nocardia sp. NBC_01327 TaxID=2903593 RepID=UPI002E0F21BA|nr:hypothetical protein OG326_24120 [Nocardia sp. NBC_01327]
MASDRDTLADLIDDDVTRQVEVHASYISHLEQHELADAVIAAGWRPAARVITDPAELDALPAKAAVITPQGWVFQAAAWPNWMPGSRRWSQAFDVVSVTADYVIACADSVTVLWEPEADSHG